MPEPCARDSTAVPVTVNFCITSSRITLLEDDSFELIPAKLVRRDEELSGNTESRCIVGRL